MEPTWTSTKQAPEPDQSDHQSTTQVDTKQRSGPDVTRRHQHHRRRLPVVPPIALATTLRTTITANTVITATLGCGCLRRCLPWQHIRWRESLRVASYDDHGHGASADASARSATTGTSTVVSYANALPPAGLWSSARHRLCRRHHLAAPRRRVRERARARARRL